jgi:hypothetical protein
MAARRRRPDRKICCRTILGVTYRNKAWALQLTPFEKQVRLC